MLTRIILVLLMASVFYGCDKPADDTGLPVETDTDTDADTDSDTDSDSDSDTDSDTDADSDSDADSDADTDTGPIDSDADGFWAYEDCDDENASVNPDASEVCWNSTDDNCDGDVDEDCSKRSLADADAKFLGESEGDFAGYGVSGGGDFNGDGYNDMLVGAIYDDEAGSNQGAVYVVNGPATSMSLADADAKLLGEGGYFGFSLSFAGDVNADGFDDVLVGASFGSAVYLILGPQTGSVGSSSYQATIYGEQASTYVGMQVEAAGDMNSDGLDDIIIGTDVDGNSAYLFLSPISGDLVVSDADAVLTGEADGDRAGAGLARGGDYNADGIPDLLVGAKYESSAFSEAGAVYVLHGPVTSDTNMSSADAKLTGESGGDHAGWSVASAGDTNADGYDDILIGAPHESTNASSAGAAYVVLGPVSGELSLSDADGSIYGESGDELLGYYNGASGASDVNADGYDDMLIGASGCAASGTMAGGAILVLGPMKGSINSTEADTVFSGEAHWDNAGWGVEMLGDTNADGYDDMLIGAKFEDTIGLDAGAAYLILGEGY